MMESFKLQLKDMYSSVCFAKPNGWQKDIRENRK